MNEKENKFFDDLENHLKLLAEDPTELNMHSIDFIFCLLKLVIAVPVGEK